MELRFLRKLVKKRVANRAFDGQVLIGGGSREVTQVETVLQYQKKGKWYDVPTVWEKKDKENKND